MVKGLHHMRSLYADGSSRKALSAEAAAGQCLRAPVSLYRQSTARGTLMGNTFAKNSLFVFNIGTASQLSGGRSLVFMEESWSACPASTWVPAMLEGVWRRWCARPQGKSSRVVRSALRPQVNSGQKLGQHGT